MPYHGDCWDSDSDYDASDYAEGGGDGDRRRGGRRGSRGIPLCLSLPLTEMTSINTSWKMKATQLENHGRKGLGASNSILPQRLNRNPAVTFYQEADANDEVQEPQNQASWAELASGLQRSPALLPCEHQSWPGGLPAGLDPCPQGMCPLGRGQFPSGFQGLLLPVAPRVLCPTELRPATKHCPDSRREQRASPIIFLIFIAYLPHFSYEETGSSER